MNPPENELRGYIQDNGKAMWTAHNNHNIRYFKEEEIQVITRNYGTLIGKGAFGEVYRGVLDDKSSVAVKRYFNNVKESFVKELIVHCHINHRNVVKLIGCCIGENGLMMVTEYISKGNLSDTLHCNEMSISLETRLGIAIGCAEALSYMHSQMYGQVIHGDIKPANILLDENLNAKISDFGISKLLSTDKTLYTTYIIGSIGYMDPLFAQSGRLTSKSDVYSFGVVLLELIARRKAIDDDNISLAEIFTRTLAKRKKIRDFFDVEIADENNMRILERIGKVAAKCLELDIDKHPEMKDVAEHLRRLRKSQYQTHEKVAFFGWAWRRQYATQNTTPGNKHAVRNTARGNSLVSIRNGIPLQQVDLEDLMRAECKLLGEGKYGTTFKATLENGVVFTVKRSKVENVAKAVFEERIEAIGAIEHELIVPLCGYYFSKDEQLLIYNYFGNGSLSSNLHGSRINKVEPAGWETRSAIALSSARAVAYIHSTNAKASHGNIKSSNILLTGSYEAHISEHGINTLVRTPASCITYSTALEVKDMQNVSQKADVYSFGVLLLELLTGVSPCPTYSSEGHDLVAWVMAAPQEQRETRVLDQKLLKDNGMVEEMLQFLQLATQCCEKRPNLRPVMSEVLQKIEEIQSSIVGNSQPMWSSEEE